MDSGADSGDILSQKKLKIKQNYDANVLYNKLTDLALLQIEEFIPILKNKKIMLGKLKSTQSPIIGEKELKDGEIDWRMSAQSTYNLIRSLSYPYVGAHFKKDGETIKVWKIKMIENNSLNIEPGKLLMLSQAIQL